MKVETYRNLEDWAMIAAEEDESLEDCLEIVRTAFEKVKEASEDAGN